MATNKSAQQRAEVAKKSTVEVEYAGDTYSIPAKWEIEVLEAFEDNKLVAVMRALLGPEQWAEFKKRHTDIETIGEFLDAAGEVMGSGNR